jgi:hypothetical protein
MIKKIQNHQAQRYCDECDAGPLHKQVDHIQVPDPFDEVFLNKIVINDFCDECFNKLQSSADYYLNKVNN